MACFCMAHAYADVAGTRHFVHVRHVTRKVSATAVGKDYRGIMFVVLLNYTAPQADIDGALVDHYEWVSRHYEAGDFIATWHRTPEPGMPLTGGVLIARAMSRGRLEAILATDPFELRKLARHEVIEFQSYRTVPEMAKFADQFAPAAE